MDRNQYENAPYLEQRVPHRSQERLVEGQSNPLLSQPPPVQSSSSPYETPLPGDVPLHKESYNVTLANQFEATHSNDPVVKEERRLSKKWQHRLYWMVPLAVLAIVLVVLFEVYKSDFERWVRPLTNWLRARKSWSWVLPVLLLLVLSFPPLFGHEIVLIVVGLTYPLGVALGIACAGAIIGEAACFVVFKYGFTSWVDRRIRTKVKWAATARVAQEAGFKGVLFIRYSIVPPHLANPLFSCTGMKFWLYMVTVVLSLPKTMVFVALGTPSSETKKGAKYAKVVAILVVVAISMFASIWIRRKMKVAIREIEAERAMSQDRVEGDNELKKLNLANGDPAYK